MLVSDIMTLDPSCCTPECPARAAAERMQRWSMGILPVIEDAETRRIVGVVTDRDLCLAVVAAGKDASTTAIRECMTRDAICCSAGEPVARALDAMREHHVRRLPVVDSEMRVVGIVSLTDIIRYAAIGESEVIAAAAQICEPLGPLGRARPRAGVPVGH